MNRGMVGVLAVTMALLSPVGTFAQGIPTQIMVRVTAHDAKIIGSGVGGARVTIIEVETGDTLATGVQEGSTGDTRKIMVNPRERGAVVYDTPGAAGFTAELMLERPTVVEIIAEGPLGTPHAVQRASKTTLLIPGRPITGDGIILELLGFTVVLEAPGKEMLRASEEFEIRANVTMLCGCPTQPGGMWDADEMTVVARLFSDGAQFAEVPLDFTGTTSVYSASTRVDRSGALEIQVIAMNPAKGNFGMVTQAVEVR